MPLIENPPFPKPEPEVVPHLSDVQLTCYESLIYLTAHRLLLAPLFFRPVSLGPGIRAGM